jgi:hypothetical protein
MIGVLWPYFVYYFLHLGAPIIVAVLLVLLAWISTAQNSPNISWGSAEAARVKIRGIGLHFMGAGLPIH